MPRAARGLGGRAAAGGVGVLAAGGGGRTLREADLGRAALAAGAAVLHAQALARARLEDGLGDVARAGHRPVADAEDHVAVAQARGGRGAAGHARAHRAGVHAHEREVRRPVAADHAAADRRRVLGELRADAARGADDVGVRAMRPARSMTKPVPEAPSARIETTPAPAPVASAPPAPPRSARRRARSSDGRGLRGRLLGLAVAAAVVVALAAAVRQALILLELVVGRRTALHRRAAAAAPIRRAAREGAGPGQRDEQRRRGEHRQQQRPPPGAFERRFVGREGFVGHEGSFRRVSGGPRRSERRPGRRCPSGRKRVREDRRTSG
jgi:hypothetical protein